MRLVQPSTIGNWQVGRVEVFFEGSWSQVCANAFAGPDADVACRQLGFGAGTVVPADAGRVRGRFAPTSSERVVPEAAVTAVGCNGSESKLLDCPLEMKGLGVDLFSDQTCLTATAVGLIVGCVQKSLQGTLLTSCDCLWNSNGAFLHTDPPACHTGRFRLKPQAFMLLRMIYSLSILPCLLFWGRSPGICTSLYLMACVAILNANANDSRILANSMIAMLTTHQCRDTLTPPA